MSEQIGNREKQVKELKSDITFIHGVLKYDYSKIPSGVGSMSEVELVPYFQAIKDKVIVMPAKLKERLDFIFKRINKEPYYYQSALVWKNDETHTEELSFVYGFMDVVEPAGYYTLHSIAVLSPLDKNKYKRDCGTNIVAGRIYNTLYKKGYNSINVVKSESNGGHTTDAKPN